jgi:hypothetical protein
MLCRLEMADDSCSSGVIALTVLQQYWGAVASQWRAQRLIQASSSHLQQRRRRLQRVHQRLELYLRGH